METGCAVTLLLLLTLLPLATADVFCDNLKVVAATLPKNTSSSPLHFATATIGQAPNVVYAFALCRGDVVNDTACADCLARGFDILQKLTPPTQQCSIPDGYYGDCHLAYSADNILGHYKVTGDDMLELQMWNVMNFTRDGHLVAGLVKELLVETVQMAARATPRRFATGLLTYGGSAAPIVRSLAQCTPDLTADVCLACLRHLLAKVNSSMAMRVGGQIHVPHCYFRYETYAFYNGPPMLRLGQAQAPAPSPDPTPSTHKGRMSKLWAIPIVVLSLAAIGFLSFICFSRRLTSRTIGKLVRLRASRPAQVREGGEELVFQGNNTEFSVFDFQQLLEATGNFSDENKIGEGGFGAVYKGQLSDGFDIAVKRLTSHSGQGFVEFKNEVQFIAKLQHMNLVRLLGCCSEEEEKILVYEYLPNKSLDLFIFDQNKRAFLHWSKFIAIIEGIAHGLLYLHKYSRLRVIHRDIKPSNILLDSEMNPKISDFGLAKFFSSNNTEGNTRRVVGTYGYMAPEYASDGIFSIKTDVFSFGVVILEILSGKRNSGSQQSGNFINLLRYAFELWEDGRWIDIIDASTGPEYHSAEMMRCINIALLCVQENAADRPSMPDVVAMLSGESMILAQPKKPAYFNVRVITEEPFTAPEACSINGLTISDIVPR